MNVYLAGPMRGIPLFNFPAFTAAAQRLHDMGHFVINPVDLDRAAGFHPEDLPPDWDWNTLPEGFDMKEAAKRDLDAIMSCDAIAMLPGWEQSTGARGEHGVAKWLGLDVLDAVTGKRLDDEHVLTEAQRLISGDRNTQYGDAYDDFGRVAGMVNVLFADKLSNPFTASDMTTFMELVKLSRRRVSPGKRDHYVDGAGYAALSWHCVKREAQHDS